MTFRGIEDSSPSLPERDPTEEELREVTHPESRGLYYVIPVEIMDSHNIRPLEKLLYTLLSGLAHKNGTCYPSDKYLASRLDVSETYAGRMVKRLEEVGLINKKVCSHPKWPFRKSRLITVHKTFKKVLRTEPQCGIEAALTEGSEAALQCGTETEPQCGIVSEVLLVGEGTDIDKSISYKVGTSSSPSSSSAEASKLCEHFISKLKEKKPDMRIKAKEKWIKDFDLMLRRDKRKPERIREVINWMAEQPTSFAYIQSAAKLRDKFDQQEMFMESQGEKSRINENRNYARLMQSQYPDQIKKMTFDEKFVYNLDNGTKMSLSDEPSEFEKDFFQLYKVRHD